MGTKQAGDLWNQNVDPQLSINRQLFSTAPQSAEGVLPPSALFAAQSARYPCWGIKSWDHLPGPWSPTGASICGVGRISRTRMPFNTIDVDSRTVSFWLGWIATA